MQQRTHSLQAPEHLETFIQQAQKLLHPLYRSIRTQFAHSQKASNAYNTWETQTHMQRIFRNPQDEFCLQTAYIHFLRLLFVRTCQDHRPHSPHRPHSLFPQSLHHGSITGYEIKTAYLHLLAKIYQPAHSTHHTLFGQQGQELYDWCTPDEKTLLALFDLFNLYDFCGLCSDILGRVYNEGSIAAKDRSEKGQFYTPPQVVDYMLDSLGIPGQHEPDETQARNFLEKTVGDLSCGSGTFLVAAASRKRAILQRLVAKGEATPAYAIKVLTETFLGFDLNPFACFLAEINLLLQCLPFLLDDCGKLCRSAERFHIYCTDALEPTIAEQTRAMLEDTGDAATKRLLFRPSPTNISDDEHAIVHIKDTRTLPSTFAQAAIQARHPQGIDYLLGNPPYVSACESATNLRYRNQVCNFGIYHLLHQRWDLFVPFFERNLQFLRPETGRLALLVSNGIETEGYAERLRQTLSNQYRLLQIDFFPGLRLFQDAAVENTIVLVEHNSPNQAHEVRRRKHLQADCTHFETLPSLPPLASNGQIFRWRYDHLLDQSLAEGTIPLCALVYIGTGIEAQSNEDLDPIVEGKRQKRFTLNDVFLPPSIATIRPPDYPDTGVFGDDVDRYYVKRTRFVAYEKYRPHMRSPRYRALFCTPEKLLLGETSGGYYDRAGLFANHSVQVAVSWKALEQAGVLAEKGIQMVLRKSRQIAGSTHGLAPIAELFDLRYLLGIINSRFMRHYLASNRLEGTRKGRIYPDVWKRLPIKVASAERQQEIATLVDAIQFQYQHHAALPPTDTIKTQQQDNRTTIESLTEQIEALVEATYTEPADSQLMKIINEKLVSESNDPLF